MMPSPTKRASSRCKKIARGVKNKCKRDTSTPQSKPTTPSRRFGIFKFFGGNSASSQERHDSLDSYNFDHTDEDLDKRMAATQRALNRLRIDSKGRAIIEDKTRFTFEYPEENSCSEPTLGYKFIYYYRYIGRLKRSSISSSNCDDLYRIARSCLKAQAAAPAHRFLANKSTDDPWNILDLRSPLPSALPSFLTGENCQLLARIRDAILAGDSAGRAAASKEQWNEWSDMLEWVLLSQGGNNTAPHKDFLPAWITGQ
ncbi:hypothetical protein ACMFMG_010009 [Clarireedia jacksonii]